MRSLSKTSFVRWTLSRVLTPLDLKLRGSRFAPSRFGMHAPLCYLTTTGRASGEPRTVPVLYIPLEDDAIAVVASNFGRTSDPGWSFNLEADPRATVDIDGAVRPVTARRAAQDEAVGIWRQFDHIWPGYETYREIAPRDIKAFVLTPTA
jgi:deazaflavin-dependent oxidoreductase (nitroreductase family)